MKSSYSFLLFLLGSVAVAAQGTWCQKSSFGLDGRYTAVAFSIGTKGYIGTGSPSGTLPTADFWEWDQGTDTWTQKADFGGGGRLDAVGFSIGTKGYIGTGIDSTFNVINDFWEYNSLTNVWTRKADFGGVARRLAVGFSIGGKGYIGTGCSGDILTSYDDFWEYDPAGDAWTQKTSLPAPARSRAAAFSIGTNGYIMGGAHYYSNFFNDLWEWDQSTDTWTQKATGPIGASYGRAGLSIGTKGYVGLGYDFFSFYNDFWEWDQGTDTWTQKANFPGGQRSFPTAFSIGCRGYVATGFSGISHNDMWEFYDNSNASPCSLLFCITPQNILCHGASTGLVSAAVSGGVPPYTYLWSNGQTTSFISGLTVGTYSVTVTDAINNSFTYTVVLTEPPQLVLNSSVSNSCTGIPNGSAFVNVTGGVPPYSYQWNNGSITSLDSALSAGTYDVFVLDSNGCFERDTVTVGNLPNPVAAITGNDTSCSGQNISLTSSGGITYSWNTGAVTSVVSVSPATSTSYTVTATDANGCFDTAFIFVYVHPLPALTISPGVTIYADSSAQLSASGNGSFQWNPVSGLSCDTCGNCIASPLQTTTYTITLTDSNGCVSIAMITVTVLQNEIIIPTIITGNELLDIHGLEPGSLLDVFDDRGRLVFSSVNYANNFCAANYTCGIYLVRLLRPTGDVIRQKLCIVK